MKSFSASPATCKGLLSTGTAILGWALWGMPALAGPSAEDPIKNLFLQSFISHWQAGDAASLAGLWQEQGDWMSMVGSRKVFKGRDQIEQVWSVGLNGRNTPESRTLSIEITGISLLAPHLAQVEMVMHFGHQTTGIIHEAAHAILERESAGWRIKTFRVARIASIPARD